MRAPVIATGSNSKGDLRAWLAQLGGEGRLAVATENLSLRHELAAVAKRLGPNLVELRRRVPGPNGRDLKAARVRLEMLDAAPGNTSASAAANAPAKAEEQAPTRAPEKTENAGNAAPSSSSDSPTAHSGLEAIE